MDLKLFRFLCCLFAGLVLLCGVCETQAQTPPITVDDNVDLFGTGVEIFDSFSDDERNTCDPEFWDVVKDRAWMEAQREVTQNWNVMAKPDSVMALGCFDDHLNKLAAYGHTNFPFEPNESAGDLAPGTFNEIAMYARIRIAITLAYQTFDFDYVDTSSGQLGYETMLLAFDDSGFSGGIIPYGLLELLVLDQLVRGVTPCGAILDTMNYPAAAVACNLARSAPPGTCISGGLSDAQYSKMGFLENNFSSLALGDRAIDKAATPSPSSSFSEIDTTFDRDISYGSSVNNLNNCNMMGQVWFRAQCYDSAMESTRYNEPERFSGGANQDTSTFPPTLNYDAVSADHDGFYTLDRYREVADANSDFRTKYSQCRRPQVNDMSDLISDIPTDDFACWIFEHGIPFTNITSLDAALSTFSAFIPPPGDSPIWSTAHDGANPPIGSAGAPDEFVDYLLLRGEAVPQTPACADPIKTGYIVVRDGTTSYEDAFCPTPGCWFMPPNTIGADGTCTQ